MKTIGNMKIERIQSNIVGRIQKLVFSEMIQNDSTPYSVKDMSKSVAEGDTGVYTAFRAMIKKNLVSKKKNDLGIFIYSLRYDK